MYSNYVHNRKMNTTNQQYASQMIEGQLRN